MQKGLRIVWLDKTNLSHFPETTHQGNPSSDELLPPTVFGVLLEWGGVVANSSKPTSAFLELGALAETYRGILANMNTTKGHVGSAATSHTQ